LRARSRGGSQPQSGPPPEAPGGFFRIVRACRRHGLPLAVPNISTTVLAMGRSARRTSRDGVVSQMQQQGSSHSGKEQITSQMDPAVLCLITKDQQYSPPGFNPWIADARMRGYKKSNALTRKPAWLLTLLPRSSKRICEHDNRTRSVAFLSKTLTTWAISSKIADASLTRSSSHC
jgi:hypothetical protein